MSFGSIKNQKYVQVTKEVYTMALEYLLKTEFSGVDTPEKLADLTGMTTSNAKFLLKRIGITQQDLLQLCDVRGIDFAVTLVMPEGKEITFIPKTNFGVADKQRIRDAENN